MIASGHRKKPPSLKKMAMFFRKSTSTLLCELARKTGRGLRSHATVRYITVKNC
jgi:hypothetical protein